MKKAEKVINGFFKWLINFFSRFLEPEQANPEENIKLIKELLRYSNSKELKTEQSLYIFNKVKEDLKEILKEKDQYYEEERKVIQEYFTKIKTI